MSFVSPSPRIRPPARIGAAMFALWSVLHIWVGVEGVRQFLTGGITGQWDMLIGGSRAPIGSFQYPTDEVTAYAQSHLILNFVLDVGGYGVLGLFVAWLIWHRASWTGYFIGLVAIGICDLSFLFVLVTSGVAPLSAATLGGPIIWFVAIAVTPFGLPPLRGARGGQDVRGDDLSGDASRTPAAAASTGETA